MRWSETFVSRLSQYAGRFGAMLLEKVASGSSSLALLVGTSVVLFGVTASRPTRPATAAEDPPATASDSSDETMDDATGDSTSDSEATSPDDSAGDASGSSADDSSSDSTDESTSQTTASPSKTDKTTDGSDGPSANAQPTPANSQDQTSRRADGPGKDANQTTEQGDDTPARATKHQPQKAKRSSGAGENALPRAGSKPTATLDPKNKRESNQDGKKAAPQSALSASGLQQPATHAPSGATPRPLANEMPPDDDAVGVSDAGVAAPAPRSIPMADDDTAPARPIREARKSAPSRLPVAEVSPRSENDRTETAVVPAAARGNSPRDVSDQETVSDKTTDSAPESPERARTPLERLIAEGPEPFETEIEPAVFRGVRPGQTTAAELEQQWGPPLEIHRQEGLVQYVYELERFPSVSVTLMDGQVVSLLVELQASQPPEELIDRLGLGSVRLVRVADVEGDLLGLAFPERGVLFSFDPRSEEPRVSQVVLETIDPQSFVLRAQLEQEHLPTNSLRDVEYALQLDAELAEAHWIRARLLERLGRYDTALEAIETAIRLEPKRLRFRLTRAKILDRMGQSVQAIAETKATVDLCKDDVPHIKAEALLQLGDLLAGGPGRDFKAAIDYHIEAIRLAEPLAEDRRHEVRQSVRQTAVRAYLATATDVAWGSWRRKEEVAKKWLQRAEDRMDRFFAETPRDHDRFRFAWAATALAVDVGLRGRWNPAPWIDEVETLGKTRLKQAQGDLLRRAEIEWELGMALYDALQVAQLRGETDTALQLGQAAVDYLEQAAPLKRQMPGLAYMLGRLYFRIGAIYAAGGEAHEAAIEWFDRAVPLMEEPVPVNAVGDVGRQGETFVSMAVSYWEVGQRDESLRLTEQGLHLMQQAVEDGILDPAALAVPYHNLAQMHRQLGQPDKAETYAQLAAKAETGGEVPQRRSR